MSAWSCTVSELQERAWKELQTYTNAPLDQRIEVSAYYVREVIKSREFPAVPESNEIALVFQAAADNDLEGLYSFIRHGERYPLGCIQRAVIAHRGAGISVDTISDDQLDAAQTMIAAVIHVVRADFKIDLNDKEVRKRYEDITDYAVVHHSEAHLVASMVRERKMDKLEDVKQVMEEIRKSKSPSIAEGYL